MMKGKDTIDREELIRMVNRIIPGGAVNPAITVAKLMEIVNSMPNATCKTRCDTCEHAEWVITRKKGIGMTVIAVCNCEKSDRNGTKVCVKGYFNQSCDQYLYSGRSLTDEVKEL